MNAKESYSPLRNQWNLCAHLVPPEMWSASGDDLSLGYSLKKLCLMLENVSLKFKICLPLHIGLNIASHILSDYTNSCKVQIKPYFSDLKYNKHIIISFGVLGWTQCITEYCAFQSLWIFLSSAPVLSYWFS